MPSKPKAGGHLRPSDLRATLGLLNRGVRGVTRLAEGVHGAVLRSVGLPTDRQTGRTRGLTGLVYRSIEEVTGWVGRGTDAALARWEASLSPGPADDAPTPQRLAALAALNGVLGDRLAAQGNPLALHMGLWLEGRSLMQAPAPAQAQAQAPAQAQAQAQAPAPAPLQPPWSPTPSGLPLPLPQARSTVVLLLHGLCMNDLQWTTQKDGRSGHSANHGEALARALGGMAIYVRYNSGLHISDNGQLLATLLQALQDRWPVPLTRLVLLGHSMGGLVARSAVAVSEQQGLAWRSALRQMVFLGTPHQGAPLERAGHWLHSVLGKTPYSAPFAALARLRSAGITDLRFGNLMPSDGQAEDRFANGQDPRQLLPLPHGVGCYAIAATLAGRRSRTAERLLGDGLVPLPSALGQHAEASRTLAFAPERQAVIYKTGHLALLSSPQVQEQLLQWLQ